MLSIDIEKRLGVFDLRPRFEADDELVVLLGPSGSGKSLTLRAIAGLLRPDRGRIELAGTTVFDAASGVDLAPQARNVGYVVQNLALFPHLSIAENIGFALSGWSRQERRRRVEELVTLLGLRGLESRLPRSISGGQQQRVALGRALAARPSVLLLDEPFTALDTPLRVGLRRELMALRRQLGLLVLFVTHDLDEAYALADRIVVFDAGAVLQSGPRDEVFRRPVSTRVAALLETRNILPGRVIGVEEGYLIIETAAFRARAEAGSGVAEGARVSLCVRPEHIVLVGGDVEPGPKDTALDARIEDDFAGATSHTLSLRVLKDGVATDCVLEAVVPVHTYETLAVASKPVVRVVLPGRALVAVPEEA